MEHDVVREARRERRALKQERTATETPEAKATPKRRITARKPVLPEHAVFLVPGLLGFERFASFGYFADRVAAALRTGLEQAWDQPVPVVALPIPPTASLMERQRRLVRTLADRLHTLEHEYQPLNVHLIGHSTGGVDCDLLTHDTPLGGGTWDDVDPRARALRSRIRTVVSIASPHQGACIARDRIARLLRHRDLRGLPDVAGLLVSFLASSANDIELSDFLFSSWRESVKSIAFVRRLLSNWELLDDLQPSRDASGASRLNQVRRKSFVTVAGRPRPGTGGVRPADEFFRALSVRASGWDNGSAEEGSALQASVTRLRKAIAESADELLIKAPGVELAGEIDAGHNDGVVNAARQLIDPRDSNELAGIVVADHFDVVGYYDRRVWVADGDGEERPVQMLSGLLHSGSGFRDAEFFELYRRVANTIAAGSAA
jgi:hypothetical protein